MCAKWSTNRRSKPHTSTASIAKSISSSHTEDQNSIPWRATSSTSDLIAAMEIYKRKKGFSLCNVCSCTWTGFSKSQIPPIQNFSNVLWKFLDSSWCQKWGTEDESTKPQSVKSLILIMLWTAGLWVARGTLRENKCPITVLPIVVSCIIIS